MEKYWRNSVDVKMYFGEYGEGDGVRFGERSRAKKWWPAAAFMSSTSPTRPLSVPPRAMADWPNQNSPLPTWSNWQNAPRCLNTWHDKKEKSPCFRGFWVVCGRFELSTSSVWRKRSEPTELTDLLHKKGEASLRLSWWSVQDLNLWPLACQASALNQLS